MTKKYFGLGVGRTKEILTKFVFLTLKSSQISEIPQKLQRNLSVWVQQADFEKIEKKQKTPLPELSPPIIRPRYDLQLNYSIGRNFNIYPPTFSMDGRFLFYYAQGSFPMQNFSHFHPTLAGPFSDQAGQSGILSNRPDSPESVVTDSDSPTSPRSSEGLEETQKKQYGKWPQEGQRALVSLWAEPHELVESKDA